MKIQHGRDLTGEEMAQILDEWVNGNDCEEDRKEFTEQIVYRTHRTIQQNIMRLFVSLIEKWASLKSGEYDARNEATVLLAKVMIEASGEKYDRYLPLI